VGSLERRIEVLEGALSSDVCPVCWHGSQVPYEIVFGDDEDDDLEDDAEAPEFCDGCGRQLNITIFFDDSSLTMPQREEGEHDD
jgi:hypothetical protein